MKKNSYVFLFILIIDFIGLFLILTNRLECSLIKWSVLTFSLFFTKLLGFKISINKTLELLYLVLIFFSFILGRVFDLYDKILWYDTLVHFISGILCFIFGLIVLRYLDKDNCFYFNILFCILITMFIGVVWEFIEFVFDYLFGTNMMKIPETGIMDTMKDLSVESVSSILISIIYLYKKSNNRISLNFY